MLKNIFNNLGLFFIILLVGTLIITIINYFSLLNSSIISVIKLIIPIISIIVSSYKLGKSSNKKGYLEGLKLGGIVVLIFMILVIILDKFDFKSIIYYLILLISSVMGSTIGINRKKISA